MIVSACNIRDGLLGKTELSGNQALCLGTLDNTASELVLLARAPCKDGTGTVKSEDVVGATGDLGDLLQAGNKHRLALDKDILSEAEDTFIALSSCVSNCTRFVCRYADTYTESTPTPDLAVIGESKRSRVTSSNLDEDGVVGEFVRGNGGGSALTGIKASIVTVFGIRVFGIVHVL